MQQQGGKEREKHKENTYRAESLRRVAAILTATGLKNVIDLEGGSWIEGP